MTTNYRNPKYLKGYEDVYFQLDTSLSIPGNGLYQRKTGHRFVVDNSGEVNPFDWYNARFNVDFKLQLLANGGNIANNVATGMVNSSFSLIKRLKVKMGGIDVYDCENANQAINIKNLMEYSIGYAESQGNEFFYIDKVRNTGINEFTTAILKAHANNQGKNENDPTK